jgi:hypothetical protein
MARFTCCIRGLVCHLGTFMVRPAMDMGMTIVNGRPSWLCQNAFDRSRHLE